MKKMNKDQKLALGRETLVVLKTETLDAVNGGAAAAAGSAVKVCILGSAVKACLF